MKNIAQFYLQLKSSILSLIDFIFEISMNRTDCESKFMNDAHFMSNITQFQVLF